MEKQEKQENEEVVVAIDIGTSRSGYALAFRHAPDRIVIPSGLKVPTALLLSSDERCSMREFGTHALSRYLDALAMGCGGDDLLFFEKFKMVLYENDKEDGDEKKAGTAMIKSVNGKEVSAETVFYHCIRHLACDAMKRIKHHTASLIHEMKQVKWIVTVPAIWSNKAKQLMRRAAEDAIGSQCHILLAYESECAALATLKTMNDAEGGRKDNKERVCVVDLGGGTADIVVQETFADGTVKEVMCATGGAWGATYVEEAVLDLLREIFGITGVNEYAQRHPDDFSTLRSSIEVLLSDVHKQPFRRLPLPHTFISFFTTGIIESRIHTYNERRACIQDYFSDDNKNTNGRTTTPKLVLDVEEEEDDYESVDNEEEKEEEASEKREQLLAAVHYYQGSLRLRADILHSCFEPTLKGLIGHLQEQLNDGKCNRMYVVGGFAENEYVYDRLCQEFSSTEIYRPAQASLAVLTGGVLYGLKPSRVRSRIVPYCYGFVCSRVWDDEKDLRGGGVKVYHITNGLKIPYCNNAFVPVVKQGEDLAHDAVRKQKVFPVADDQVKLSLKLMKLSGHTILPYYNHEENGLLWTECGVITIQIGSGRIDREISVELRFGSTEITLHAFSQRTTPILEYKTTLQF